MNVLNMLRSLLAKGGKGTVVVAVGIAVMFAWNAVLTNKNAKLKNEIASLKPDTVYVVPELELDTTLVTRVDSFYVQGKTVRQLVIQNDTITVVEYRAVDTLIIRETELPFGHVKFFDDSHKLVSIAGRLDYPYARQLEIVYTTKEYYDAYKFLSFGPRFGAHVADGKVYPAVGFGVDVKRFSLTADASELGYGVSLGFKIR